MIAFLQQLLGGMVSTLTFTRAPLYRYPHRSTGEAFRGDWNRIGKDISASLEKLDEPR